MDLKHLKIAAVAIGLGALGSASASAAAAPAMAGAPQSSMIIQTSAAGAVGAMGDRLSTAQVEKARWRGRRYYGYRRYRGGGRWVGPAIATGIAALIIGGSIARSQAGYRDRWEMCADRYQSFSWADGTFQPYDGPRRLCPYLEP